MARDDTEELERSTPGVAFEVGRFEWAGDDRLELVGRWSGLRGHRFLRPTLDVVVDGERRRMLAVLEHKPWAAEPGEDWVAAFTWRGDRATFEDAELTVSPDLAVELPSPGGTTRSRKGGSRKAVPEVERRPARRPRTAILEEELASALSEAQELREQLRAEQTNVRGLDEQLRHARAEATTAEEERDAARATADELAGAAEKAREDADTARIEADRAREETESARADTEKAREDARKAAPEAEQLRADLEEAQRERDAALERVTAADRERVAATEARDRARDERNAWMQRARAVAAGRPASAPPEPPSEPEQESEPDTPEADTPDPPTEKLEEAPPQPTASERRTIQIGERPAPVRVDPPRQMDVPVWRDSLDKWGPRLLAALALVVLAAIIFVLVGVAL